MHPLLLPHSADKDGHDFEPGLFYKSTTTEIKHSKVKMTTSKMCNIYKVLIKSKQTYTGYVINKIIHELQQSNTFLVLKSSDTAHTHTRTRTRTLYIHVCKYCHLNLILHACVANTVQEHNCLISPLCLQPSSIVQMESSMLPQFKI